MSLLGAIRRYSQVSSFIVGLVLVAAGIVLYFTPRPHPYIANALLSVGSSILAASILIFLSPIQEDLYKKLVRLGIVDLFPSRRDIQNYKWVDWLREARHQCVLLGIAHNNWCRDPGFEEVLLDRLRHGVVFEILFLDPASPLAEARAREDKPRDTVRTIRESIRFMWELRERIEEQTRKGLKLYVYDATPSCGTLWVDGFMVVTHYVAGLANVTSPALLLRPAESSGRQDLYALYQGNVTAIKNQWSTEITAENVGKYS